MTFLKVMPIFAFLVLNVSLAQAGDAVTIAALTGSLMGKGVFCGFSETNQFAILSGRAMKANSTSSRNESDATKQFMITAKLAAALGPQGEPCSEFRSSYLDSLNQLSSKF